MTTTVTNSPISAFTEKADVDRTKNPAAIDMVVVQSATPTVEKEYFIADMLSKFC